MCARTGEARTRDPPIRLVFPAPEFRPANFAGGEKSGWGGKMEKEDEGRGGGEFVIR